MARGSLEADFRYIGRVRHDPKIAQRFMLKEGADP
jgi:hypothetical protein